MIVDALLKSGANPDLTDKQGHSEQAFKNSKIPVEHGADVNAKNDNGDNLKTLTVKFGVQPIIDYINQVTG